MKRERTPGRPRRPARFAGLLAGILPALVVVLVSGFAGNCPSVMANDEKGPLEIVFHVREDEGVDRRGEPVAVGLPVPFQSLADDPNRFRLLGPTGKPIAAEFTALARWDGRPGDDRLPIRWILVEFLATIRASRTDRYRVVLADAPSTSENGILVADEEDGIWIDTGPARFRVSKRRFDLFERVVVDRDRDGKPETDAARGMGGVRIVPVRKGGAFHSHGGPPPQVKLTRRGSRVIELSVRGKFPSKTHNSAFAGQLAHLEYDALYRFHADSTRVDVGLTLRNPERSRSLDIHRGGAESFHEIEDLSLRLGVPESQTYEIRFGRDLGVHGKLFKPSPPPRLRLEGEQRVTLYQDSSGGEAWAPPKTRPGSQWKTTFRGHRYLVGGGEDEKRLPAEPEGGLRSPGWVRVKGESSDLWLGFRDFWENYPKALRVSARGVVELSLLPGEWSVPHRIRGGLAKTHHLRIDVLPAYRSTKDEELEAWLRAPLSLFAEPSAYRDSFAFGFLSVEDRDRFKSYEKEGDAVIRYRGDIPDRQGDIFREREDRDLYGWMNYGDHYRGGSKETRYFGNNEFDLSLCMLLQYVRKDSHDVEYFRLGESMVRHLLDIDTYHTDRDLFWANHGIRKHDASGITDHGNAPHTSHFWIGGASLYYLMTGDPHVAQGLREVGSWLRGLESKPREAPGEMAYAGEVRSRGWVVHALLDLYEVFGEASYLRLAERVVHRMVRGAVDPRRGFIINSAKQVFPWQMGYITDAVGRYLWIRHRRGEEDQKAADTLVRMLDYMRKEAWLTEAGSIAYNLDPFGRRVVAAGPNVSRIQSNGFAYGYLVTGERAYLEMARKTFHSQDIPGYPYYYSTTLGTPAKGAGFRLRFGQAYMALAQLLASKEPPTVKLGAVRKIGKRGPHLLLSTDRPLRCTFEVRSPGDEKPQTWRTKLRFPGPRLEKLGAKPGDPRDFVVSAVAETRGTEARGRSELTVRKAGEEEESESSGADSGSKATERAGDEKGGDGPAGSGGDGKGGDGKGGDGKGGDGKGGDGKGGDGKGGDGKGGDGKSGDGKSGVG